MDTAVSQPRCPVFYANINGPFIALLSGILAPVHGYRPKPQVAILGAARKNLFALLPDAW